MRKKDSLKNLYFGLFSFVITTLMGVAIPRLFILSYGSEVNGLINSVKQIFAYFTLLEAGVGGATLQALYGPIARNDKKELSAILSATNHFYVKTGIIYAIAVALLALIYPFIINSELPKYIILGVILLQGESGVIKYFVTAKLQLLLKVDGKNYILINLGTIFEILSNFTRIVLIYVSANILLVQAVFCLVDILQVIIIVFYTRKHYGWLNLKEKPNFKAISQKNSVLVHQISGLVFNNTDTIVLTFFCGLKTVSVYAMYAMLYGMTANVIGYISSSVNFAMGQVFNSDKKKYELIQETYETYYLSISFALFTITYIFILPFLRLYTSGVTDINYIDKWIPVFFLIIQILNYGRSTSNNIIDFAGYFKQTRLRSIIETVINLSVSLLCIHDWGIYGVLIGTIVALLYRTNDMILYANHIIMNRSAWPTYRRWLVNIGLVIICSVLGRNLPQKYSGYISLIGVASVVSILVLVIFILLNSIIEKGACETAILYIKSIIRNKKNID